MKKITCPKCGETFELTDSGYADILASYCGRPKSYYDKRTYGSEPAYGELRKAFPDVLRAMEKASPGCIVDNGRTGKGKAYRYVGESDDPLAEERKAVVQKSVEDYVAFCKASAGILPARWFSSYFENTQLLLDTNREAEYGNLHIRYEICCKDNNFIFYKR